MTLIQVSVPSSCCGSAYRRADENGDQYCNLCGEKCEFVDYNPVVKFVPRRHGKLWNKKKHRYLTEQEIKNGETGG